MTTSISNEAQNNEGGTKRVIEQRCTEFIKKSFLENPFEPFKSFIYVHKKKHLSILNRSRKITLHPIALRSDVQLLQMH